jgi:hypothetical protein
MNDYPASWSVLMRTPVIEARVEMRLNDFLPIATVVTVPGLKSSCPAGDTESALGLCPN